MSSVFTFWWIEEIDFKEHSKKGVFESAHLLFWKNITPIFTVWYMRVTREETKGMASGQDKTRQLETRIH